MIVPEQILNLGSHGQWRVVHILGEGGQGSVWRITPHGFVAPDRALKWYHTRAATHTQRQALEHIINRGAPNSRFLWPRYLVDGAEGSFGYVMDVRPESMRPIGDLLLGRVTMTARTVLRTSIDLATAFLDLHLEGLCYRDINFGNVFVEPESGEILICDNDNVGIDGVSVSPVLGTRKFMAPEIVRRDSAPSADTDRHSLAVLLFYLFVFHHPLLGLRDVTMSGRSGETVQLGDDPVFIFDPERLENRPDPVRHSAPLVRWPLLPNHLKTLFTHAFTVGLFQPQQRVRESVWRAQLARIWNLMVTCSSCNQENFTDTGVLERCFACNVSPGRPLALVGGDTRVILNPNTQLYPHHIEENYDFSRPIARLIFNSARGRWGLQNLSNKPWRVSAPKLGNRSVAPNETIGLLAGLELQISGIEFRLEECDKEVAD